MNRRVTVMVSSTARDLPQHRNEVLNACLQQGMFPLMMEHLPASDANAIQVSLDMVDQADLYLGIFAYRYGYVPRSYDISITEMEYNHAVERGIPRIILVMDKEHPLRIEDVETGEAAVKLQTLKDRILAENTVNFFKSPADLRALVVNSLSHHRPPSDFSSRQHQTWASLLAVSSSQVYRTIQGYTAKFDPNWYVRREAEGEFEKFVTTDKLCLMLVDRAGRGKTNLVCTLAMDLVRRGKSAVLLPGDSTLTDDHSLGNLLAAELGYEVSNGLGYQTALQETARLLQARGEYCYVFLDGISQSDDLRRMTRTLRTFLLYLDELKVFKVCATCRDLVWPIIAPELPTHLLYAARKSPVAYETDPDSYQVPIGDFSDAEFDAAVEHYAATYSMTFTPTSTAREQLRHPLLLRLFCEANRNQALGVVASVPVATTFDQYLRVKTTAVATRLDRTIKPNVVRRLLMNLAHRLWQTNTMPPFNEADIASVCPPNLDATEGRTLLHFLAEEGVVVFREEPLAPEQSVHLVFEALQDYLLFMYLIARLPDALRPIDAILSDPRKLFDYFSQPGKRDEGYLLFALFGMILGEGRQRRRFLRHLLQWDFPTFCSCLARIPPTGSLANCTYETLSQLGEELCRWYSQIVIEVVGDIQTALDPFNQRSTQSTIGVTLTASPGCREVSYHYQLPSQSKEAVHVTLSQNYPTWTLDMVHGDTRIKLHDPDNGILIPVYRGSPDGTVRTLNVTRLPFSGASLNVPERIALYDVWDEIENLVGTSELPSDARPLLAERARASARMIPELAGEVEGLTEERLNQLIVHLLAEGPPGAPRYAQRWSQLSQLRVMLRRLGEPLTLGELPQPDRTRRSARGNVSPGNYSDEALSLYLRELMSLAFGSYRTLVDLNLPHLAAFLNTYLQFPCAIIVLSDRQSVRYAFGPVDDEAEAKVLGKVIPTGENGIGVADMQILADQTKLEEHTLEMLGARPTTRIYVPSQKTEERKLVRPIDVVASIDDFFGATPLNALVKKWLKADLRQVFGF